MRRGRKGGSKRNKAQSGEGLMGTVMGQTQPTPASPSGLWPGTASPHSHGPDACLVAGPLHGAGDTVKSDTGPAFTEFHRVGCNLSGMEKCL